LTQGGVSLGVDDITDRFGFRKFQSPIRDGAEREFTRVSQTRAELESEINDRPQQDWRSMTMQLDDVFSGK